MSTFGSTLVRLVAIAVTLAAVTGRAGADEVVTVFDRATIEFDTSGLDHEPQPGEQLVPEEVGQALRRRVSLPAPPQGFADVQRIVAVVRVEPVAVEEDGADKPGDPWTRLGWVSVLVPDAAGGAPREVELLRFITGFGADGEFEQDVTALAPVLHGEQRFRAFIDGWMSPGWRLSLELRYSADGVGPRRPALARSVFSPTKLDPGKRLLRTTLDIPPGLDMPRLRILTTGHGSQGGDEFVTRTHVLRIDGREVARWRPWTESGGTVRALNPWAGRRAVDGREIWSSDFDRSGWTPGIVVQPFVLPLPELAPGRRRVELEIVDFDRKPAADEQSFWQVSASVVADGPWPAGARAEEDGGGGG
jgi:hypothetical protein